MADKPTVTREQLIDKLNEDLSREYQAIIAYVVYSQALKGAQYMSIAKELEKHAAEELQHALTIAKNVDYLGGMPTNTPKPVKLTDNAEEMLRADLQNESDTIRAYRQRLGECEALGGVSRSPKTSGRSCGRNRNTWSTWRRRLARMRRISRKNSWRSFC